MNTPFVPMMILVSQVSSLHEKTQHVDTRNPEQIAAAMENVELFRPNYGN